MMTKYALCSGMCIDMFALSLDRCEGVCVFIWGISIIGGPVGGSPVCWGPSVHGSDRVNQTARDPFEKHLNK